MKKKENKTCSTCSHWKNQQAELDYSRFHGICTCFKWKFTNSNYESVMVLDRNNPSEKHARIQSFESQSEVVPIGVAERSRYCFVTHDEFGCIHHKVEKE